MQQAHASPPERAALERAAPPHAAPTPLIGESPEMKRLAASLERIGRSDATVLIVGESGTGKELVASRLHAASPRAAGPYLALNCGAVTPTLIESELFGHERGSFTGASRQHAGYFERAEGGTLFLDEVTEMPLELQVRLLRVLETRTVSRVGSSELIAVDVRVIAATNRDPREAVRQGKLREDLLYRLQVVPVHVPPLRARTGDVRLLAEYFLAQLNAASGTSKVFSESAMARLESDPWPGNVREGSTMWCNARTYSPNRAPSRIPACITMRCRRRPPLRRVTSARFRSVSANRSPRSSSGSSCTRCRAAAPKTRQRGSLASAPRRYTTSCAVTSRRSAPRTAPRRAPARVADVRAS